MKTATTMPLAERLGHGVGLAWRRAMKFDSMVIQWLSRNGIEFRGAKSLLWIMKSILVAALLFFSIWLASLVVVVLIVSWLSSYSLMINPDRTELRDGHSGVGVYDQDDWRIDPVDIDDI